MKLTPRVKAQILKGLRAKRATREQLADGVGKSPSWVSKVLSTNPNTSLRSIDDDDAIMIENFLGIELLPSIVRTDQGLVSDVAAEVVRLIDTRPEIHALAEQFLSVVGDQIFTPSYIPKAQMADLGNQIIRISFANQDKPGKVARLVLEMLGGD